MEIYTIQMAKWREAEKLNALLVDTTVKSGLYAFAPTWDMVYGHKRGDISDETYTNQYHELIRMKRLEERTAGTWNYLFKNPRVAIACYCKAGKFCHRHILKEIIVSEGHRRGVPVHYLGEIVASDNVVLHPETRQTTEK